MVLTLAAIIMNAFLIFSWWGTTAFCVNQIALTDPAMTKQLETLQKSYQNATTDFPQTEADVQKSLDAMAPVLVQIDWFKVALITSGLAFCVLGFFTARWLESADWLGALPVLAIVSGQNPSMLALNLAERGISSARLSWGQHALLLGLQIVCVYLFGYLGLRLKKKRVSAELPENSV